MAVLNDICHPSIRIFREWLQERDKRDVLSFFLSSSISLPERLITLAETNGSRYDYEGEEREIVSPPPPIVDAECTTSDVTDVIFFFRPRKPEPHSRGKGGGGENNLKAELNFSSSESFVRALGGGQWLNGDVSRKVDSRERPALYRPSIHPLLALHPPPPLAPA